MDTNNDNKFETVSFEEVKQALGTKEKEQDNATVVTYEEKLNSLDALINFKTKLAGTLKKDVSKLILLDRSIQLILNNFVGSCKASSIKLGPFNQLPNTENKVNLDSNNNFIKICKFMYQMVMNKNKEAENEKENILFVLGGVGDYYFSDFYQWLAEIEYFKDYIDNIQNITCEDRDFNAFKRLIGKFNLKFEGNIDKSNNVSYKVFQSINIPKRDRISLTMWGKMPNPNKKILIALDAITGIGFILSAFFAINYFWLGFIEMSLSAAIVSMVVPGVVGLLCLGICIFLLKTKRENTGLLYEIGDTKLSSERIVGIYGKEYSKDNTEINFNDGMEGNVI